MKSLAAFSDTFKSFAPTYGFIFKAVLVGAVVMTRASLFETYPRRAFNWFPADHCWTSTDHFVCLFLFAHYAESTFSVAACGHCLFWSTKFVIFSLLPLLALQSFTAFSVMANSLAPTYGFIFEAVLVGAVVMTRASLFETYPRRAFYWFPTDHCWTRTDHFVCVFLFAHYAESTFSVAACGYCIFWSTKSVIFSLLPLLALQSFTAFSVMFNSPAPTYGFIFKAVLVGAVVMTRASRFETYPRRAFYWFPADHCWTR